MLFLLDPSDRTSLKPLPGATLAALGWNEKDLENLVAQHLDRVVRENQLLVIHQERRFQEEPDIMAVDRDGRLHIFELKRWIGSEENLLQVLRYGQRFGRYDYDELNYVFSRYVKQVGGEATSLDGAHATYFELEKPLERSGFNRDQVFVVMINGLDRGTREAIAYWSGKGLPVNPLVYRVYRTTAGDLLFEVEPYGTGADTVEVDDEARGLVVVNTNVTYMADAWREMLLLRKVAAYYGRKTAVDRIARGDAVALYHTGVGVIALGRATADVRIGAVGQDAHQEHYVPCEFEFTVDPTHAPDKAVSAWEINEHLGSSHRFRQTVYTLPAKAAEFIRERLRSKGALKELP